MGENEKLMPTSNTLAQTDHQPRLRFAGFTEPWEKRKLSSIFLRGGSGGTPKSSNHAFYEGNIPFLGISDISKSNGYISDTEKHITPDAVNSSSAWIVPAGSISLAMYASVGKLAILNVDVATSQAFYNMVFESPEVRNFIYQRLNKALIFNEWNKLISTGTQDNLNAEKVKNFEIEIPTDSREIKSLGDFLGSLDNLIAVNQQLLDSIKEEKKGLLQKVFSQEIRFGEFQNSGKWVERKLGDVLSLPNPEEAKVSSPKQLLTLKLNLRGVSETTGDTLKLGATKYFIRHAGQFIYGKQNFFNGSMAIIPQKFDLKASSSDVPSFDINSDYDQNFVYDYLARKDFYTRTEALATGTGSKRLHTGDLLNIPVKAPSLPEQRAIGTFFQKFDEKISLQQKIVDNLKLTKKGLLQQMFVS